MGKYSVPAEIRAYKPKGTMVKNIDGRFYVYECKYSKIWVEDEDGNKKRKSKTEMGKCIGSITLQDGFVSNANKLSESEITCIKYGDYAFAINCSKDTLGLLKKEFNTADANQIYTVALIFFVEGFVYMKRVKDYYDYSYLSLAFPDSHVGYSALENLYKNLGQRSGLVDKFEKNLFEKSSKRVAIDGHVISCTSEYNDLSEYGYKASKLGSEQLNWINVYDVVEKRPLLSQMCNGSDPDKTSVKLLFERFSLINTEFCVDRGFNTKQDKELMSENGNTYIVPMITGRKDYTFVYNKIHFTKKNTFIYDKDGYSSLIYFQVVLYQGVRCIAYKDTTRESYERKTYINNIRKGRKAYTEDGLKESEKDFGLFLLETNNGDLSPQEIFSHYKDRWSIETFYNYIKNDLDFNALYQQTYGGVMGLSFIITITSLIYYDVKNHIAESGVDIKDLMHTLRKIKAVKSASKWKIHNVVKKTREISELIGFDIPEYAL